MTAGKGEKTLYLHIGLPKTATSYLQNLMSAHRGALREQGAWLPSRPIYAHRLAVETLNDDNRARQADVQSIQRIALDEVWADIDAALADEAVTSLILSSEYFSRGSAAQAKTLIADRLGIPARIVVFLRRQDYLTESGYNQDIKAMGGRHPLHAPEYNERLDWDLMLDGWSNAFGRENIRAIGYDRAARDGAVQRSFFEAVDAAQILDDGDLETGGERVNSSLPADLLEFKRLANMFGEFGLDKWLAGIAEAGEWAPKFRMSAELSEKYRALYADSNQRVVDAYFGGDKSALALDEPAANADRGVDFTNALPAETLGKLFAVHLKQTRRREKELRDRIAVLEERLGIKHDPES